MALRDVLGDMRTDNVVSQLKELSEQLQKLGFKEPRPWKEFFAHFKPPKRWHKTDVEERITTNFLQYRTNYTIILLACVVLVLITKPLIIAVIGVCAGCFLGLLSYRQKIEVAGRVLDTRDRIMVASSVSAVLLLVSGALFRLIFACGLASLVVAAHMLFRPRTLSSKYGRFQDEIKLNNGGGPEQVAQSGMVADIEMPDGEDDCLSGSYATRTENNGMSRRSNSRSKSQHGDTP